MENSELEALRYPIGKFAAPTNITNQEIKAWIEILEHLPGRLEALVSPLSDEQLATPYRPGGWTVRQVVHHLSDSHHHSYIRFKWALTEDNPVIKPYLEKEWAKLSDAENGPIQLSIDHLKAVHAKLVYVLRNLSEKDSKRKFTHPEGNMETTLVENIARYAWHGSHHFAHIENLIKRERW